MSFRLARNGAVAVAAAAAMALAGCSSGSDSDKAAESCDPTQATVASPGPVSTDPLNIGTLLPETGSLAFLGPPMAAGVKLAVNEINADGGVLGKPVKLTTGDSGDTTTDTASATVDRELADGTQVIVGAASSAVSLKVLDKIASAGAVMFSPANTSDQFTCYKDQGMYFRTAPPDTLQSQALAQTMAADGVQRVSILALNDPYGTGLAANTKKNLEAGGIPADQIQTIIYDPNAQSFNAEIDQIKDFKPDGVAVIGFEETSKIITRMHEVGIGPSDGVMVYGTDGNMGNALGEATGPGLLKGMKGTTPETDVGDKFRARLKKIDPKLIDYNYAGESYDAVVISALAASKAKSTNGKGIAANIVAVTTGGTECATFKACLGLLDEGKEIAYKGPTGNLKLNAAGDPTKGSYSVREFGKDNKLGDPKFVVVTAQ